jgi:hypothetical protein
MTSPEADIDAGFKRAEAELSVDDPFWPAQLAVTVALILYIALPDKLTLGPDWLLPAAEGLLLVGLVWASPWKRRSQPRPWRRQLALALSVLVAAGNSVSLGLLIHFVVKGGKAGGYELVLSGAEIWTTAVLIFAVIYWELDGGGPRKRAAGGGKSLPDLFSFPQWADLNMTPAQWRPMFVDYLYLSFTNCTAFSPTDTMPVKPSVKLLMMFQGFTALVTVGVIVARAISLLG